MIREKDELISYRLRFLGAVVVVVACLLGLLILNREKDAPIMKFCLTSQIDNKTRCRPGCSHGFFSLYGMNECHPWLSCEQIEKDILIVEKTGAGAVKNVSIAKWGNYVVAVNTLRNSDYSQDFQHGLTNLINLQGDHHPVVQLIGYCRSSETFISEYHALKSGENIQQILRSNTHLDNLRIRFRLCLSYLRVIRFLHESPQGTLVMCDSNTPEKALSQFLLRDDLTLILNDADALPRVDRKKHTLVKCGHRELFGDFVAPEQLWPFDSDFDDEQMPSYDEKVDIWKIPAVCKYILNDEAGSSGMLFKLFNVNSMCTREEPSHRPTARDVFTEYEIVYNATFNKS